jgi:hypothetical protein
MAGQGTGRRWKRKHTLGCFGTLVAIVVLVLVIQILVTPWAFHIGGSFTPMMRWTGVAEGSARNGGGTYAMQIQIVANQLNDHACDQFGCDDFHGSAAVCTAAGEHRFTNISGKVGGWTSVDGQKMSVDIAHGTTTIDRNMQLVLTGTWHGKVYQANDKGYLVRDFDITGVPRPAVGSAQLSDAVQLAFQPGNFAALCAQVKK